MWFTSIDLASGLHQLPIAEEGRHNRVPGCFVTNRMEYGIMQPRVEYSMT